MQVEQRGIRELAYGSDAFFFEWYTVIPYQIVLATHKGTTKELLDNFRVE